MKKPFLNLLSKCNNYHQNDLSKYPTNLIMELLKPNTANFIRNHFGEHNFSKYYMKTIRLSLKNPTNVQIRKTGVFFNFNEQIYGIKINRKFNNRSNIK